MTRKHFGFYVRQVAVGVLLLLLAIDVQAANSEAEVAFAKKPGEVYVTIGGKNVATYMYADSTIPAKHARMVRACHKQGRLDGCGYGRDTSNYSTSATDDRVCMPVDVHRRCRPDRGRRPAVRPGRGCPRFVPSH